MYVFPLAIRFVARVPIAAVVVVLATGYGHAQTSPEAMRSACQARAASVFGTPAGAIEVKYEGRRTDGTYAVNGSARSGAETFQCSFARDGRHIDRFVVNARQQPAAAPATQDDTAVRAGRGQFNATGRVPCAANVGEPMGQCTLGVARGPGGSATVVVTRFDGTKRAIFFEHGRAVGADVSQSEGSRPFSAKREGDLNLIRIGPERYEIPDAVVVGG